MYLKSMKVALNTMLTLYIARIGRMNFHAKLIATVCCRYIFLAYLIACWQIAFTSLIVEENKKLLANENRYAASAPIAKWRDPIGYIRSLKPFIEDNILFRERTITYYNYFFKYILRNSHDKIIWGREDWIFYTGEGNNILADFLGKQQFTLEQLNFWKNLIQARAAWLSDRNQKYFFVPTPNKESIYFELMPSCLIANKGISRLEQLNRFLSYYDVNYIDLLTPLRKYKSQPPLYYKHDSHWNQYGGLFSAKQIVRHIHNLTPDFDVFDYDAYTVSRVRRASDLPYSKLGLGLLVKEDHDTINFTAQLAKGKYRPDRFFGDVNDSIYSHCLEYSSSSGNNKTLLILGDSYSYVGNLREFLAYSFRKTYTYHAHPSSEQVFYLASFLKPDIIIEQRVERNLNGYPTLSPDLLQVKEKHFADKEEEARKLYLIAESHSQIGDTELINGYSKAINSKNLDSKLLVNALIKRGTIYLDKGITDKAINDFSDAILFSCDQIDAFTGRGLAYIQINDFNRASLDLFKAIAVDPNVYYSSKAHDFLAARTTEILHNWNRLFPSLADAGTKAFAFGNLFFNHGDYNNALLFYTHALKTAKLSPEDLLILYSNRALIFLNQDKYILAIDDITLAIDSAQKLSSITKTQLFSFHILRARAYLLLNRNELAYKDLGAILSLDPEFFFKSEIINNDVRLFYEVLKHWHANFDNTTDAAEKAKHDGLYFLQLNDFDKSFAFFSFCIDSNDVSPSILSDCYRYRSDIYSKKGQQDAAISDLAKAIELTPHDFTLYNLRGGEYFSQLNFDLAFSDINSALNLSSCESQLLINRAYIYLNLNNVSAARKDVLSALSCDPNTPLPQQLLFLLEINELN